MLVRSPHAQEISPLTTYAVAVVTVISALEQVVAPLLVVLRHLAGVGQDLVLGTLDPPRLLEQVPALGVALVCVGVAMPLSLRLHLAVVRRQL